MSPLQAFMLMAMARKGVLGGGESRLVRNWYRGNFDKATALFLKGGRAQSVPSMQLKLLGLRLTFSKPPKAALRGEHHLANMHLTSGADPSKVPTGNQEAFFRNRSPFLDRRIPLVYLQSVDSLKPFSYSHQKECMTYMKVASLALCTLQLFCYE